MHREHGVQTNRRRRAQRYSLFYGYGHGKPAICGALWIEPAPFAIQPTNPTVIVNDALQFSATTDVTWATSCGTIGSTSGIFSAPATTGTCTVTATELEGNHATVSTSAKITSSPASGTLGVYPTSASVYVGTEQIFQAQLSTIPDGHSLTYSIDGVVGGNATTGTITNVGVYTAPTIAGTHHLSVKDNSLGTTATRRLLFSRRSLLILPRGPRLCMLFLRIFSAPSGWIRFTHCRSRPGQSRWHPLCAVLRIDSDRFQDEHTELGEH